MICDLCGAGETRRLFIKDGSPFFECASCGFRFSRPVVNPNYHEALRDYEESYLQYLEDHPADELNHRRMLAWVRRLAPAGGGEMLDIGCGSGKWVRALRARGVPAVGIEPAAALFGRYLSKEPCFKCVTAEALAATDAHSYATITLWDVLEHVESPRAMLSAVRGLLAPGGRLFVSTPDVGSAVARLAGRHWHFYNKYHLSYLSPRTLEALGRQVGLRVVETAHPGKRFPAGYLLRYGRDFLLGRMNYAARRPSVLDRVSIPLNLFDIMYVCLGAEG